MTIVVAYDEIDPGKIKHRINPGRPGSSTIPFFRSTIDTPDSPSAYINRYDPGRGSSPHYHENDQFQIIIDGKGEFGRHAVAPYCVHFSRAYTSYGPLQSDSEKGWAFLVLRSRYDSGAHRNASDILQKVPNRRPWQISKHIAIPALGMGVDMQEDPDIRDDQGLFVRPLSMGPNTSTMAPDPAIGEGQFLVLFKGSLMHEGRERKAMAVVFVKPGEAAYCIQAGAQGLQGAIFNLPKAQTRAVEAKTPSVAAGFRKWQCLLCAFAYDEAIGMPEEGIAAGTRWEDVPESWSCPDCSANKNDFQMVEV